MRITYVLPRPELGGGNKVIFQHAELLLRHGHRVTVLAEGPAPDWIEFRGTYVDTRGGLPALSSQDLVIATFWTTLSRTRELALGPPAHFCQGYEGSHAHYRERRQEIEAVYAYRYPSFTVTPYLGDLLRHEFGTESRVVPPVLDPLFRPARRLRPRRRPWIAIPGVFAAEVKGVPTAIRTVKLLRESGHDCRVLRFSTVPLCEAEKGLLRPDRYLCGVRPEEVAHALHRCDLLIMPSEPEEGFGLPLLEAMACGVPAVASEIPSTVFMAKDAAVLVPLGDATAFAKAADRLLTDTRAWRRARRAGRRESRRFSPETIADRLVGAVRWASRQAPGDPN